MRFQLALVTACGLFLTACHSTQPTTQLTQLQAKKTPFSTANSVSTKRINTTECNDADDWYLDGFRVGKSSHSQKTEMLQQRMQFCQLSKLPQSYKQNWERGFAVGEKGNHRPARTSKKK